MKVLITGPRSSFLDSKGHRDGRLCSAACLIIAAAAVAVTVLILGGWVRP